MDGVTVTARIVLRNEPDRWSVRSGAVRIGRFIAGTDDNGDLLDSCGERLFDQDTEQRFLVAVSVDKSLERQCALRSSGGSDNSFLTINGAPDGTLSRLVSHLPVPGAPDSRLASEKGRVPSLSNSRRGCLEGTNNGPHNPARHDYDHDENGGRNPRGRQRVLRGKPGKEDSQRVFAGAQYEI